MVLVLKVISQCLRTMQSEYTLAPLLFDYLSILLNEYDYRHSRMLWRSTRERNSTPTVLGFLNELEKQGIIDKSQKREIRFNIQRSVTLSSAA